MISWKTVRRKLAGVAARLSRWDVARQAAVRLRIRHFNPERARRFPLCVQIEATSKCNLRCPTCSHSREQGSGEHLTEDRLRAVLDWFPWTPSRVILSGIGEPLMNPQFPALVDILAERGIQSEFYTNGTLLKPPVRREILSRPSIDRILISCDGARKETFEELRRGASFDQWKQHVGGFLVEARHLRGRKMSIGLMTVINKNNLHELGQIVHLAAELGCDRLVLLKPIPVDTHAASLCPSDQEVRAVSHGAVRSAKRLGLSVTCWFGGRGRAGNSGPRCLQPWEYIFVRATGDVAPCSALFGSEKAAAMGNVLEQPFREVWQGDAYRQFRRTSALGTNPLCRVCPYH